ncbi:hypothetical protein [Bacillus cereus]|nr:hypothetical protein [Bacillus cereus]MDA2548331.1 hypothetical protein [Bacillus cereus]MDA2553613.1 hypothetical protein [Bacillus cereus]MDZ4540852.1 hypothetical protein [Bacillus cereus]WBV49250.1 hypothetical protein PFY08_06405 [Bacillus cereus]
MRTDVLPADIQLHHLYPAQIPPHTPITGGSAKNKDGRTEEKHQ